MKDYRIIKFLALLIALMLGAGTAAADPVSWTVRLDAPEEEVVQSNLRYGLFLEDINHALDGGLYAELIRNRSFEYGSQALNGPKHGWTAQDGVTFEVIDGSEDGTAIHPNNPHYARITNNGTEPAGILGSGYLAGFAVEAGADYNFSVFLRADTNPGEVTVSIRDTRGTVYAEAALTRSAFGDPFPVATEWQLYSILMRPKESVSRNLRICLQVQPGASIGCDLVSLMPADTFAGLPVRKDLGERLSAIHPAFLRFPGGCAAEGRSEESMYSWKASVGYGEFLTITENAVASGLPVMIGGVESNDVELTDWESISFDWVSTGNQAVRPQGLDIWQGTAGNPYYTTYGFGFYEFFCLCEALGCEPLPVLNAGMTCPIQSLNYIVYPVNSDEFKQCVQDALDLVEFCRGGIETRWGNLRFNMGHHEPFNLTMIAIGNEQWQGEYFDHYLRFVEAFDKAAEENPEIYGDIKLIVANGPAATSDEGWDYADGFVGYEDQRTAFVDEHFYMSPDWFFENTGRYDRYDRKLPTRVFLGEYASQGNQLINALAEAAFMMGMERNGDMVSLACYAPLFGNNTQNQWTPDMIFFSNTGTYVTPNYHVQSMFMNSTLARILPSELSGETERFFVLAGTDEAGDLILRVVNAGGTPQDLNLSLTGFDPSAWETEASVLTLAGNSPTLANSFLAPEAVAPTAAAFTVGADTTCEVPAWSLTVIRIPARP